MARPSTKPLTAENSPTETNSVRLSKKLAGNPANQVPQETEGISTERVAETSSGESRHTEAVIPKATETSLAEGGTATVRKASPKKSAARRKTKAKTQNKSAKKSTSTAKSAAKQVSSITTSKPNSTPKNHVSTQPESTIESQEITETPATENSHSQEFVSLQRQRLLDLRDELVDTMAGVARGNLREHAEGSEASAFGMHQADAGSDAYDRDLALNILSREQDALYEIDEALARIQNGAYGVCEMSGDLIPSERLEANPFARLTVACQQQVEKEHRQNGGGYRPTGPIFKRSRM